MQIELRPLSTIVPYEQNPRNNESAVDAVAASIREFGFRQPIVVDEQGVIIVGHTRYKAAQRLGLEEVPVHVALGLSPAQAKAYRIADNQTASIAEWDDDRLVQELTALQEMDVDLDILGFPSDRLEELLAADFEPQTDPDAVPEPPDEPITQPGDLWVLGRHRLLCGDSSNAADVDRLLAGTRIQLACTDPPYNVNVEPRSHNAIAAGLSSFPATPDAGATSVKLRAKDRPIANDVVSKVEYERLLNAWFGNMARVLEPGRAFYIWGGYANGVNYPPAFKANGLYFSQALVWVKEHPVMNRKDFMGNFEMCQPPDTKVLTASGTSSLSAMRDHDRVVSFYAHSSAIVGLREGLDVRVATRHYEGSMYGVTVGANQSWCTDGHFWTVRLTRDYSRKWCVYLMRRGAWWRVGVTKMRTTWGFGLKGRLCSELGDEGWILSLHDSHADARVHEQLVSVQFGIPQTCWQTGGVRNQRQLWHVEEIYRHLDLPLLETRAETVLAAYHRRRDHPFVRRLDTRAKFGARQSIQVRACNLLPEIMEIPIPGKGSQTQWQPLRAVDRQAYSGLVHSLGVEKHEHYIADGMVTHNCYYGWREGAAHVYLGPNNAVDVWSVKKVSPNAMIHLTQKPTELASRAMEYSSRYGENVLDLFGGSGTTLIAAEESGRNAYLMEIDQLYCDVIVRRFEEFTGTKAERVPAEVVA